MAHDPRQQPEVSVVVESYKHGEGCDLGRVPRALLPGGRGSGVGMEASTANARS